MQGVSRRYPQRADPAVLPRPLPPAPDCTDEIASEIEYVDLIGLRRGAGDIVVTGPAADVVRCAHPPILAAAQGDDPFQLARAVGAYLSHRPRGRGRPEYGSDQERDSGGGQGGTPGAPAASEARHACNLHGERNAAG